MVNIVVKIVVNIVVNMVAMSGEYWLLVATIASWLVDLNNGGFLLR